MYTEVAIENSLLRSYALQNVQSPLGSVNQYTNWSNFWEHLKAQEIFALLVYKYRI